MFLYKPYNILLKASISDPRIMQEEGNNLEKVLQTLQALTETTIFFPPEYHKTIYQEGEINPLYWKEIVVEFIKQKHNADTSYQGFPIKIFIEGPPHKPFFIVLTLWEILVIGPTKKLVAIYVVGDLAFLD